MNIYSLEKILELFESVNNGWCYTKAQKPTVNSIEYINKYFGMKLPEDLIAFIHQSTKWSSWLASRAVQFSE